MLRAVLLGVLSITAVASCKKSEGTAASAVGVAAGKVLEVKGSVTVKHGDATKPLAANDTVEADDTVITGADGSVVIELAHNLVRWELGANKQQKVKESIAWKAPKNTGPAANVEQDTAAAGRPAERSAVGTTATAVDEAAKDEKEEAPPPPPAAEAAPAPAAAADEGAPGAAPEEKKAAPSRRHSSRHHESAAKKEDAVALPSADEAMGGGAEEAPHEETMRATRGTRGAQITAKAAATAPMAPPKVTAAAATGGGGGGGDSAAASLIAGKQPALKACLAGHADSVTLTVTVTNGKASVKVTSKSAVSAALDACVKKVIGTISFSGSAHASTTIKP